MLCPELSKVMKDYTKSSSEEQDAICDGKENYLAGSKIDPFAKFQQSIKWKGNKANQCPCDRKGDCTWTIKPFVLFSPEDLK